MGITARNIEFSLTTFYSGFDQNDLSAINQTEILRDNVKKMAAMTISFEKRHSCRMA